MCESDTSHRDNGSDETIKYITSHLGLLNCTTPKKFMQDFSWLDINVVNLAGACPGIFKGVSIENQMQVWGLFVPRC